MNFMGSYCDSFAYFITYIMFVVNKQGCSFTLRKAVFLIITNTYIEIKKHLLIKKHSLARKRTFTFNFR